MEGDAEELPFADDAFDRAISVFGAIFAPRHERAAAELLRVTRPGGTVVLTSWLPDGVMGQMLAAQGTFIPPPAGAASPVLWGVEEHARAMLAGAAALSFEPATVTLVDESVEHYLANLQEHLGPLIAARAALEANGRWPEARARLHDMYAAANGILGNIVKVTPSSKVVGDLALHLVAVGADPQVIAVDRRKRGGRIGQDDRPDKKDEQHQPRRVERGAAAVALARRNAEHESHRQEAERNVDEKDRLPAERLGEIAAGDRAERVRTHRDAGKIALITAALPRRDRFADQGLRQRHQAAAAESLHDAERGEQLDIGGERAQHRADHEDAERHDHHPAPAEGVAKPPIDRRGNGVGDQVRHHHPGGALDLAEARGNRG